MHQCFVADGVCFAKVIGGEWFDDFGDMKALPNKGAHDFCKRPTVTRHDNYFAETFPGALHLLDRKIVVGFVVLGIKGWMAAGDLNEAFRFKNAMAFSQQGIPILDIVKTQSSVDEVKLGTFKIEMFG